MVEIISTTKNSTFRFYLRRFIFERLEEARSIKYLLCFIFLDCCFNIIIKYANADFSERLNMTSQINNYRKM